MVRLAEFDTTTPLGRSNERYRRVALSTLVSVAARGITVVTTLISVPLTLSYLGTERYGLWMTISSIIAMLSFTDLGLGNGLLNSIAATHGRDDRDLAARFVSTGLVMLTLVAVAAAAVFAIIYPHVVWPRVFNVTSPAAVSEAGPAAAAFMGCFLLGLPLGVPQQVRIGYQESYVNSLFVGAGNLLGLALVLIGISAHAGLPFLVLAMAGAPIVTAVGNGLLLAWQRPYLRPRRHLIGRSAAHRLLRTGLLFFVLQIAVAVAFTSDSIVAAQVIGPSAVADYTVAVKLFLIPTTILTLVVTPLWPAYREAMVRGDADWIRATLRRSLKLVLGISVPCSLVLVAFGMPLVRLWVGTAVEPSFLLILGVGVWTVMGAVGNALGVLFNGAQIVRFQVLAASTMATVNIVISVLLAQRIGVAGVVWGTILAYGFCTLLPLTLRLPSVLAGMSGGAEAADA